MSYTPNSISRSTAPPGVAALIVATEPGRALLDVIEPLVRAGVSAIVVVDDGSSAGRKWVLDRISMEPTVHLLRHARPQGRGAALKTGLQYITEHLPHYTGVVTTAADARYAASDVVRLMRALHSSPRLVILGGAFCGNDGDPASAGSGQSLRTRMLGLVFQVVTHISLRDVQTPLRALPVELLPLLLKVPGDEHDYEFSMLLHLAHHGYPMAEQDVYGGAERPVGDSGRMSSSGWLNIARALLRSVPLVPLPRVPGAESALDGPDTVRRTGSSKAQQTR